MRVERLRGWNVSVDKQYTPDEDDYLWVLSFTEMQPPTGHQIMFEMNRDTRDGLVRALTDGIVLAGGELPRL